MQTENATDKHVAEYLESIGVSYKATLRGEVDRGNWKADEWALVFTRPLRMEGGRSIPARALAKPYFTGLGHRKTWRELKGLRPLKPDSMFYTEPKPVAPVAAGPLASLLMDADSADENFHDWCGSLGYDTDSRKALETYEACCSIRADLRAFFTRDELTTLREMLVGY